MIAYRDAVPGDGAPLAAMAARCFTDTFGDLYAPSDLDLFLAQAFGEAGLAAHVADPGYAIRVACAGEAIAGFCKLGGCTLPAPARADAIELKQLYVLGPWQGAGIAAVLMEWAIDAARGRGATTLVLGVYVDNHRAKRFYARYGFREIGAAPFAVGTRIDDDRIWSLDL